jgi:cysteine synthase A
LAKIGRTPLVRLRLRVHRRWRDVWLKLEQFNPGGSVKDRTAYALVFDLVDRGILSFSGETVVESTSGNLGIGLALVCAELGYEFVAVTDPMASAYSIAMMSWLGARVERVDVPDENGMFLPGRIARVQEILASTPGAVWTNQYCNLANPRAHREQTGPELLRQAERPVACVFVAVSTGGTLKGISQYMSLNAPRCRVVAVDLHGSRALGGPAGRRRLPGIGSTQPSEFLGDRPYAAASYVSDGEAIAACRALRSCIGLSVGGSSGAVLAAAARYLATEVSAEMVVCVCPDGGDRYETTLYDEAWLAEQDLQVDILAGVAFDDVAWG